MRGTATAAEGIAALGETGQVTPSRLCDMETAGFGTSHAVAGAKLLSLWGLPADIVEAAARHDTARLPTMAGDLCSAVALAHAIVEAELGAVCGAGLVHAVEETELGAAERSSIQLWRDSLQPRPSTLEQ